MKDKTRPATLSTGEAARRLGVVPDTILKWIKQGRLPAVRTAGGHHRIDALALTGFSSHTTPFRCWEYFSVNGAIPQPCAGCVVYRVEATRCFEARRLGLQLSPDHRYCVGECEDCPYYREVHGLAARVLIVTNDARRREILATEAPAELSLHFAASGYEAARAVGEVHPRVVVVDAGLPGVDWVTLVTDLRKDSRIPWVRVFVAGCSTAQTDHGVEAEGFLGSEWGIPDLLRLGSPGLKPAASEPGR